MTKYFWSSNLLSMHHIEHDAQTYCSKSEEDKLPKFPQVFWNRISLSQVLATVTYSVQLYFAKKKSCHPNPSIINEKRMTLARRSNANQPRRWSTVLPCLGGADSGTNATKLKSVSTSGPEVKTNPSNWHSEIFTKVKYFLGHFFSEVGQMRW